MITLPTGLTAELAKRFSGMAPVSLVDVLINDGSLFYWADIEGSYPKKLGLAGSTVYSPWVKRVGPIRQSRSLKVDAGDLLIQNLSGTTVERDVSKALKNGEFEGAFCVLRFWNSALAVVEEEFHGVLSGQRIGETDASFRLTQLFDPNDFDIPAFVVLPDCTWRYKSSQCGSASGLSTCSFDFAACTTRSATERFNGVPAPGPAVAISQNLRRSFSEDRFWRNRGGGRRPVMM